MPAYVLPLLGNKSRFRPAAGPHFDVLIDMAIADKRQDDVLRWYDAMSAGQKHRGTCHGMALAATEIKWRQR